MSGALDRHIVLELMLTSSLDVRPEDSENTVPISRLQNRLLELQRPRQHRRAPKQKRNKVPIQENASNYQIR